MYDNWDDFDYKTLFHLIVFDDQGEKHDLGNVKIGFLGQTRERTADRIESQFDNLPEIFFSLGQDADYYQELMKLSLAPTILSALGDVVQMPDRLQLAEKEPVFKISLTRSIKRVSIDEQFKRILNHEALLTKYNFFYEKPANVHYSGIRVEFTVEPNSTPPTNIHILIGRNGVGKTTLLNNMAKDIISPHLNSDETGYFAPSSNQSDSNIHKVNENFFAGVVSVSFSAFDPFPQPKPDESSIHYSYVGLKKYKDEEKDGKNEELKSRIDLCSDFINSIKICFALVAKRERWKKAVQKLESDLSFAEMDLCQLIDIYESRSENFSDKANSLFKRMSSGHAIVLLTLTNLVEKVEEKTLVLLDEPESHLHPPLLSAFTRALSDLLVNRNGVAIIATHSPVVLQEVPKSCVSIIRRIRLSTKVERPEIETFAENVGVLTREVFGLEVAKSGFHDLFAHAVAAGKTYDQITKEYKNQIGFEGKIILRSMITARDKGPTK